MASQASLLKPPISEQASVVATREGDTGPIGQLIGIVTRPADTFRRMRDSGRGYWWLIFAANVAGLALTAAASASSMARAMAQFAGNAANTAAAAATSATSSATSTSAARAASAGGSSVLTTIAVSLAGGVALMLGDLILRTLVVSGMSLALGGKASFKQSFRLSLWTSVPFILRCLVQSAAMFATGGQSVSGLSGVMTTAESQALPLVNTILSAIDFYMLWSAILLAIGVSVTASVGKGKGIAITLVYLVLALGGILALRAISTALASALGSTLGNSGINLPGVSGGGGMPGGGGGGMPGGGGSGGGPSGGPGGAPPGQ